MSYYRTMRQLQQQCLNGVNRWTFQQAFNIYRALHKYQLVSATRINHFPVTSDALAEVAISKSIFVWFMDVIAFANVKLSLKWQKYFGSRKFQIFKSWHRKK